MSRRFDFTSRMAGLFGLTMGLWGLLSAPAQALPSYARQTGMDCAACHIGAFGPQLTPAGMRFKLGGYTDSDGKGGHIPLSGMVRASYSNYKTTADDGSTSSKNSTRLDEASVFLAGKLTDHLGSFTQVTYSGTETYPDSSKRVKSIDNADIRFAMPLNLGGADTILGVSVNNNPGVQDPLNTLPVWGFPYASSPFGGDTGASFVGLGLGQRVLGASAYAYWNNSIYGELGTYRTLSPTMQSKLGLGRADDPGHLGSGNAYWRLAYLQDYKTQNWSAGIFGFNGSLSARDTGEKTARFRDFGVDGSYQFLGNRQHIATVNASYIREKQGQVTEDVPGTTVKQFKIDTSYVFRNTYGATVAWFQSKGAAADDTGTVADNKGYILEAAWTPWGKEDSYLAPWANLKIGAQYVGYTKYDNATDGAHDHNTFYLFAWSSF